MRLGGMGNGVGGSRSEGFYMRVYATRPITRDAVVFRRLRYIQCLLLFGAGFGGHEEFGKGQGAI